MPKVKLVDFVNNSMRMVGVRNWRVEAKDRDGWRGNLKRGLDPLGLQRHYYYYYTIWMSLSQAFLPGTSLEPAVIPTAHASSFTLQYFPYYV